MVQKFFRHDPPKPKQTVCTGLCLIKTGRRRRVAHGSPSCFRAASSRSHLPRARAQRAQVATKACRGVKEKALVITCIYLAEVM